VKRSGAPVRCDALVVGAGFGGLGAALAFAERGLATGVLEALVYPGGCASTFERGGHHYESGATLFSGFGTGQWFERLVRHHGLAVELDWLDPVIELVTPDWSLPVPRERARLVAALEHLATTRAAHESVAPGAIARFFAVQRRAADALWPLLDDPARLPPFGLAALSWHARRALAYAPLAGLVGRSLASVAERSGAWASQPVRVLLDALSQITIQCSAREAEAPFALATLDYPFRGTAHVVGGIGELAHALADALPRAAPGSAVHYAQRATAVQRVRDGARELWRVHTTRGCFEAPRLALDLLPQAARVLLERGVELAPDSDAARATSEVLRRAGPRLARDTEAVAGGWGACMLYLVVDEPPGANPHAHHLELVHDPERPFVEGNHVFVSIGGAGERARGALRAPAGRRTVTVSTHIALRELLALADTGADGPRARRVAAVQAAMRATLARLAPQWWAGVVHELPGSPRTFERFTRRPDGFVGGVPRRRGFAHYLDLGPRRLAPGLALVGDSVFPGQSTLATALGGAKAAAALT